MKKKVLLIALAAILFVGASIGGTLAWLTAKTDTITNTFTVGKVGATLTETGTTNNQKSYHVVPGQPYSKDPKAGVTEGSEDAYLFVKIDKSTNFDTTILSMLLLMDGLCWMLRITPVCIIALYQKATHCVNSAFSRMTRLS